MVLEAAWRGCMRSRRTAACRLVSLDVRYLQAEPDVTTILVGAARLAELEESVSAAREVPLPPVLHQAVEDLGLP